MRISKIHARQILDSRGQPTIEVDLFLGGKQVRASTPEGASRGKHEARELRDHSKAFKGQAVTKAVRKITNTLAPKLIGKDPTKQESIDMILRPFTKTVANATDALSIAVCKAGALANGIPVYKHIQQLAGVSHIHLPVPCFNIINGGAHAGNDLAFQEYMFVPHASSFSQAVQMGSEVYHKLKEIIAQEYGSAATAIGDEGGFAPPVDKIAIPLELIKKAAKGYAHAIFIDAAASQFYKKGTYQVDNLSVSPGSLAKMYAHLAKKYPVRSIEDPFQENDFNHYAALNTTVHVVGDDLTVTNPQRIAKAIAHNSCSTLLVKPNQIGTITDTLKAIALARKAKWRIMVSHRSGETNDDFIADMAVGTAAEFIKAGAPCRGERLAKYNRLLRIEEERVKYPRKAVLS